MSQLNLQQDRDSFLKDVEAQRDRFVDPFSELRTMAAAAHRTPTPEAVARRLDQITERLVAYCYAARADMQRPTFACRENLVLVSALAWWLARDLGIENELPFGETTYVPAERTP